MKPETKLSVYFKRYLTTVRVATILIDVQKGQMLQYLGFNEDEAINIFLEDIKNKTLDSSLIDWVEFEQKY